jgi:cell division protein FtsB
MFAGVNLCFFLSNSVIKRERKRELLSLSLSLCLCLFQLPTVFHTAGKLDPIILVH